ncbi:nucleotidyltransferase family protein [Lysobacter hankyongensis]|uniref:Nucleotidyltransferase family protein n=1 Tax=Lysobacter hankyongensis TaxID=1176535 RepID=A0ABP9B482_9GAMM
MSATVCRALFQLLTTPADAADTVVRAALQDEDPGVVVEIARRERCLPNLLDHLGRLRGLDAAETDMREALETQHLSSLAILEGLPAGTVLLKGANIHRHYPAGAARYSGDVDLMLRGYADLGPLHAHLQSQGYVPFGSGLWGFRADDGFDGALASLRYWHPERDERMVSIEVQVGGFPISERQCLRFDELCRDAERLPGKAYLTLAPTAQLLLALADFVGRQSPISVRHLADVVLVARHAPASIDIDHLRARVRTLGLMSGVDKLLAAAHAKGLLDALPAPLLTLGEAPARPSASADAEARRDPRPRGRLRHALASGLLAAARQAYRFRPDARWSAAWSSRPALVRFVLDSGHRVAGIPMSFQSKAGTHLLRAGSGLYLSGGSGVYALSLCGDCTHGNRKWLFERLRATPSPLLVSSSKELP